MGDIVERREKYTAYAAVIGSIIVAVILVLGTIWMGQYARRDTELAVRSVSSLYMDELAERREKVVESNLQEKTEVMQTAISLLKEEDLGDAEHLQAYQVRMKRLYKLERFAFVDTEGLIYTSQGTQDNIGEYQFDYRTITGPEISVQNLDQADKSVVIAVPVDLPFCGKQLAACFMEMSMDEMLSGISLNPSQEEVTFCNLYTSDGVALSNTVLGGLAVEDNLLDAMQHAEFKNPYSYEKFREEFGSGTRGEVSFTYGDISETLSYVPVEGTNWLLTYLIRESVISDQISSVNSGILFRSIVQSVLTVLAMAAMFGFIISQNKRNARLRLEKETADAANRVKQQEMEGRLALQEKLLEEEKQRRQHENMITAMASDYRSVYHVDLDEDIAVSYRSDPDDSSQHPAGEHFAFHETFAAYAERCVAEPWLEGFLQFIEPENIRSGLKKEKVLGYRYLVNRDGREYYEMIRCADVQQEKSGEDHEVHAVGLGLMVIDAEMRQTMAQQRTLREALETAEQANKAKTAFLSNMSHEIRTPMNAIIGLNNIALNDAETPEKTRHYLEQIGASAQHLLNLINDILDMSRIESGRMTLRNEEFSFPELLEAVNTIFSGQCQDKGLEYQCRLRSEVADYYIGDSMKLRQILINILGNAVKFTPPGGKVELSVERTAQFAGKSTLSFTISDTGIGISEEYLSHIFDAFSQEDASNTSKYGSTGLGLAITKSIVEMMNGNIQVRSTKGKGSVFTVTVTLSDSERADSRGETEEINPGEMTVLVVDDDPVAREHARLVLEKAGIASELAESGRQAVEMVRLRQARQQAYDLILVDWKMPEMDGVETTRQIRELSGDCSAIIILTAYRWDEIMDEASAAGVDSFIPKPLFAGAVLEEFRSARKRRQADGKEMKHRADLNGRRILLAEDTQVNAEIMMMVLQMRGMTGELAVNGRIAVEMFESHPEGYYDAILMDMRMPEMDGLEATRRIRAMDRKDASAIPIIALTANAFDEDVQRSLQAGLNAHLSKPVQPETLYETLESLIRD